MSAVRVLDAELVRPGRFARHDAARIQHWHRSWRLLALGVDMLAVYIGLGIATLVRFGGLDYRIDGAASLPWQVVIPVWIATFAALRLYAHNLDRNIFESGRRVLLACLAAPTTLAVLAYVTRLEPSRGWVLLSIATTGATVCVGRLAVRRTMAFGRDRGIWLAPTVVVGGVHGAEVVRRLHDIPRSGLRPVASCGFETDGVAPMQLESLPDAVLQTRASCVVVVAHDLNAEQMATVMAVADSMPIEVLVLPGVPNALPHAVHVGWVGTEPALAVSIPLLRGWQHALKRGMDVVVASIALLAAGPVMAVIALALKLEGGSAIFRQERVGRNGEIFTVLKFRSMISGAERHDAAALVEDGGFFQKQANDARITPLGRLLRKTSLDELPQLVNVLRGEMSIVGPRPLRPGEGGEQSVLLSRRACMRPGLTGLWQVSGRSKSTADDRARLDLTYVQSWSILLDLYVMVKTIPALLSNRGAY